MKAKYVHSPNYESQTGKLLKNYLTGTTELNAQCVDLLFTANRFEQDERIKSYLTKGQTIVTDRYIYSGYAFSQHNQNIELI